MNKPFIFKISIFLLAGAFLLVALILLGLLNNEKEKSNPELSPSPPQPLTDVAPPLPKIPVPQKAERVATEQTEIELNEVILPDIDMDFKNPPQWTEPIALPKANPQPPDPTIPPPIKVDPRRLPQE